MRPLFSTATKLVLTLESGLGESEEDGGTAPNAPQKGPKVSLASTINSV